MNKTYEELERSFRCHEVMSKALYEEVLRLQNELINLKVSCKNFVYDINHCNFGKLENGGDLFLYRDDVNACLIDNGFEQIKSTSSWG